MKSIYLKILTIFILGTNTASAFNPIPPVIPNQDMYTASIGATTWVLTPAGKACPLYVGVASPHDIMIPTKTQVEWDKLRAAPPPNLTLPNATFNREYFFASECN